jgi:hypothetical protein
MLRIDTYVGITYTKKFYRMVSGLKIRPISAQDSLHLPHAAKVYSLYGGTR